MNLSFHIREFDCRFYLLPTVILTWEPGEGPRLGVAWLRWEFYLQL